jgi:hypothetical protein
MLLARLIVAVIAAIVAWYYGVERGRRGFGEFQVVGRLLFFRGSHLQNSHRVS